MYLISHRGNISGREVDKENSIAYITKAIVSGYDVEVDVRNINGCFYLGHDEPQYKVEPGWLVENKYSLWIHCKNLAALQTLLEYDLHVFTHDQDEATLTSEKYIWTYPGKELFRDSICVLPEISGQCDFSICCGICSDVIERYKCFR